MLNTITPYMSHYTTKLTMYSKNSEINKQYYKI